MTKSNLETGRKERAYLTYRSIIGENKAGSWSQELMKRPWRRAPLYWLAARLMFSNFSHTAQAHLPRVAPLHELAIKKIPSPTCPRSF